MAAEASAYARCPNCGSTEFREEQYPATVYWDCRISVDGEATDYSDLPVDVAGDPRTTGYRCRHCGQSFATSAEITGAAID